MKSGFSSNNFVELILLRLKFSATMNGQRERIDIVCRPIYIHSAYDFQTLPCISRFISFRFNRRPHSFDDIKLNLFFFISQHYDMSEKQLQTLEHWHRKRLFISIERCVQFECEQNSTGAPYLPATRSRDIGKKRF